MVKNILFVCLGNICRSPTAEGVLRARAPEWRVDSAGTGGWHVGDPPYPPMQDVALRRGYDLSALRARRFEVRDFERFDLILGMDASNMADIEAMRPVGVQTRANLLTAYLEDESVDAVPDPYYTRDFDGAIDLVERAIDALCRRLAQER